MQNIEARIRLEKMFKSLSIMRDTQDYYIKTTEDCDEAMSAIMTSYDLSECLLEIKEIKNLLMEQEL